MPELPGAGDTALVNSVAYSRIYWKHFHKIGEYKGVKQLGVFTHGPGQMFTKKPVNVHRRRPGPEDPHRRRRRRGGGQGAGRLGLREAGARVLRAAAAPGVADGVFFPMESIISFKLDTVLEQATLFPGGMYSSAFGFFMNEDKWNKLPKQDQDAIEKLSGEHIARLAGKSWDEADQKGLDALKKSGVKIVDANPALRGRGEEALGADHRGLDHEGQRQGRGRRQDPRRVPRGAEEGRRRQVNVPDPRVGAARRAASSASPPPPSSFAMMLLTFVDVVARYVFNRPLRGAFEVTELMLLVLIFAGLPLVSYADEHVTMDFIDRVLAPAGAAGLRAWRARRQRRVHVPAGLAGLAQGRPRSGRTATPPTCCASSTGRSCTSWR